MATSGEQPTASLSEAKAALAGKEFPRAIEKATEAIAAAPKEALAYVVRAEALRRLNRPERALADLAVAIRLQPDRPSPYVIRAEILKKRCQFDQSIADATHAIFLDPDNAAAFSIRASCRKSIGDVEGASADHEELVRIDPTRPGPRTRRPPRRALRTLRTPSPIIDPGQTSWTTTGTSLRTAGGRIAPTDHAPPSAATKRLKSWERPAGTSPDI